jgi:uncharacterized protein
VSAFVDTSALLAVLDADDRGHAGSAAALTALLDEDARLLTTSYVLVETFALVQRRLGMEAVVDLESRLVPLLSVQWVDEGMHREAVAGVLAAGRRTLSLVDCASFAAMRRLGLSRAFTLDGHFADQGFECVP